jgi:hypothetical protein
MCADFIIFLSSIFLFSRTPISPLVVSQLVRRSASARSLVGNTNGTAMSRQSCRPASRLSVSRLTVTIRLAHTSLRYLDPVAELMYCYSVQMNPINLGYFQ